MPRQRDAQVRRLFQSDGYTFICWEDETRIERMLACGEIVVCADPRTKRAIGFKLAEKLSERISSIASLLPGRTYDPMMKPPSLNYEIPHAGDSRKICMRRYGLRHFKTGEHKGTLGRRIIRVSAKKIDFTSAHNLIARSGANLPHPNVPSSSLNSATA